MGGIAAALVGLLIGLPCLRLRAAPYIAITTLAFAEIARIVCRTLAPDAGEMGLWGIPAFPIWPPGGVFFGGDRTLTSFFSFSCSAPPCIGWLTRSVGVPAIREEQDAAMSRIDRTKYKLLSFIISSFWRGRRSFYAHYILSLTPSSVFSVGVMSEIIAVVLVGGLGSRVASSGRFP